MPLAGLFMHCWLTLTTAVILLAGFITAVKREDFKTCNQSGFCSRQREYPQAPDKWLATEVKVIDGSIKWKLTNGEVFLQAELIAMRDGTIRLQIDEPSRLPPRYRLPSGDIVLDKQLTRVSFDRTANEEYSTDLITVRIENDPFSLKVFNQKGQQVLSLNDEQMFTIESVLEPEKERFKQWTDEQPQGRQSVSMDISFPHSEHLIGIPEHASSVLLKPTKSKSGTIPPYSDPYRLFNLDVFEYELDNPMALYGAIPFMMAIKGGVDDAVGIFWNNPSETWVDVYTPDSFEGRRVSHFISETGIIDLFIFVGPKVMDVLTSYYQVTGLPQLPPIFSLGYHQCRWNYMDEEDLLEINSKLDEHGIPADVLWLDIEHTDGKRYFTWNKDTFPNPKEMQEKMIGRKLVTIVDPHIKKDDGYNVYTDLVKRNLAVKNVDGATFEGDCWPGRSVWPDFLNPTTREWWKSHFNPKSYPVI